MTAYVQLPSETVLQTERPEFWPEAKRLTTKVGKALLVEESRTALLALLSPNGTDRKTVWTVLTHVSSSGMSRSIRCLYLGSGEPHDITHHVARLIGAKIDEKNGGLKMGGCGMDMGFAAVYQLGSALWPNGTPGPHSTRNREPDTCGGYAILQRWL